MNYYDPLDMNAKHEKVCARLEEMKAGAQALVDAVERYARQECLRSELMAKKETLKSLLK